MKKGDQVRIVKPCECRFWKGDCEETYGLKILTVLSTSDRSIKGWPGEDGSRMNPEMVRSIRCELGKMSTCAFSEGYLAIVCRPVIESLIKELIIALE